MTLPPEFLNRSPGMGLKICIVKFSSDADVWFGNKVVSHFEKHCGGVFLTLREKIQFSLIPKTAQLKVFVNLEFWLTLGYADLVHTQVSMNYKFMHPHYKKDM